jgi:hypothetical protein
MVLYLKIQNQVCVYNFTIVIKYLNISINIPVMKVVIL